MKNIGNLFTHTESLMNHIYWFKQDFNIPPKKEHVGTAINWNDIISREHEFLKELVDTISEWVYNKTKAKQIIDERLAYTNSMQNASSFLTTQAFSKFRSGHPQGQFGELLLFNFIQYFFEAVPLLRKQKISTSHEFERFGADAIHYKNVDNADHFILGESKCYMSNYQFNSAFKESLDSIVKTFEKFDKELDLYVYDDFLEPELESIAKQLKNGTLKNVHLELVCLIAYNENKNFVGNNEEEIKQSIKTVIQDRCANFNINNYNSIDTKIVNRLNYIIFPIKQLDSLLEEFQKRVGIYEQNRKI